jgi:hypothetical protein
MTILQVQKHVCHGLDELKKNSSNEVDRTLKRIILI